MKILITGWTGFIGNNIYNSFINMNNVDTLSRNIKSTIQADLTCQIPNLGFYDLIIHCSGNAHKFEKNKVQYLDSENYKVNVLGTQNLLNGINNPPKYLLLISSVSVYGLYDGDNIDENHPLNPIDNYSKSKIQEEKIVMEWCNKYNVLCTIFRLPLVYGENAPGNIAKIRFLLKWNILFQIGKGTAKKSIVYINDVSNCILNAIEYGGIFNLTDRYHPSVNEFYKFMKKKYFGRNIKILPQKLTYIISLIFNYTPFNFLINIKTYQKLTCNLTFDDTKAVRKFQWNPHKIIDL